MLTSLLKGLTSGMALLVAGCSNMMDTELETQLLSISPLGGAENVPANPDIMLTFNRPIMAGMEQYLVLHQGGLSGTDVSIACSWSDGQRTMFCRPDLPLAPGTRHTVHVGGGMMDAAGRHVGMGRYGGGMGGQWASGSMMGGQSSCRGTDWMHENGSYGMAFEFTTR